MSLTIDDLLESEHDELKDKLKPRDFFFNVFLDEDDNVTVLFNPVIYWNQEGSMFDQELPIPVPDHLFEVCEGTYETENTDLSVEDIKKELLELGFRVSKEMDSFLEENDEFFDEDEEDLDDSDEDEEDN